MGNWLERREFPLLALTALLITEVTGVVIGRKNWPVPGDLWQTMTAATRLAHLDIGGLYTQPTHLLSLPGTAVILLPAAAAVSAAGLALQVPGPHAHPGWWLVAGPYQIVVSCVVLFAADALAEQLGASRGRRALLAVAGGVALIPVVSLGHPEDAASTGLLLYAVLALSRARLPLAGWLAGAAVCVQPLVLLAVPVLLAVLTRRQVRGFLVRAALPSAAALGAAAAANWHATVSAVTSQPVAPSVNHPTLWASLAPHASDGYVASGPVHALTILLACCVLAMRRRWLAALAGSRWPPELLGEVLWWAALALALRSFSEVVMTAYYPWPAVAVALVAASAAWRRLVPSAVAAAAVTAWASGPSHSPWIWWVPLAAGLAALLFLARPRGQAAAAPLPAPEGPTAAGCGAGREAAGKAGITDAR